MASTIYSPQNPSPRNEVRDLLINQNISVTIDGVKCTDYQIEIFKVSDNTAMHDTGKLNLVTPLADGEILIHQLAGGTLSNTGTDSYKWKVTVWNSLEEVTTREFQFFAKTTPVLTFTPPATITTQSHDFSATVSQAEGDIVNNYTFELYDNLDVLIEYSTLITNFNIYHTFDGFTNGDSLKIRVYGTTTGDVAFDSGLVAFTVVYAEPELDLIPDVQVDNETSLVTLTRPEVVQTIGVGTGDATYDGDIFTIGDRVLTLAESSDRADFTIGIPLDFTVKFKWKPLLNTFEGRIIQFENGLYELSYESERFIWTINGTDGNSLPIDLTDRKFYIVLLPTKVEIRYKSV